MTIDPFRLDYPLSADSLVLDAGAYLGEFTRACHDKWGCSVVAFEPLREFYDSLERSKLYVPPLQLRKYGLGDSDREAPMCIAADSSSEFRQSDRSELVSIRDADDVLSEWPQVDLLKLNIEGGEYEVLERLIGTGAIRRVRFIQVQFHMIGELQPVERREAIRRKLRDTHREQWCEPFVWESWERK